VSGLVGSSVQFTWTFSDAAAGINWGLANKQLDNIQTLLVFLESSSGNLLPAPGLPEEYSGHVNGSLLSGSRQVIFTLSSLSKSHENTYGCYIQRSDVGSRSTAFDYKKLVALLPAEIWPGRGWWGCVKGKGSCW